MERSLLLCKCNSTSLLRLAKESPCSSDHEDDDFGDDNDYFDGHDHFEDRYDFGEIIRTIRR